VRVTDPEATYLAEVETLLGEEAARLASLEGLALVPPGSTAAALEAQAREECFEENACLGRIALAVEARCVVAVAVAPAGRQLRVSARMVDARGEEVPPGLVRQVVQAGRKPAASRQAALTGALAQLPWKAVRTLPAPVPPAPVKPAVVEAAPAAAVAAAAPHAPPPAPRTERTWLSPVALGLGGAGLLAGGAAVLLELRASAAFTDYNATFEAPGLLTTGQLAELQELRTRGTQARGWATVGAAAGAATLAGAVLLYVLDAPPAPAPGVRVTVAPGQVGISGVFP
jgi:hypothetical protein